MSLVLLKVYASFFPVPAELKDRMAPMEVQAMGHAEDWLFWDRDMLRFSFEGIYFPLPEILEVLTLNLPAEATGKLDFIDLENWTLTRHVWNQSAFNISTRNLNQVLSFSGH